MIVEEIKPVSSRNARWQLTTVVCPRGSNPRSSLEEERIKPQFIVKSYEWMIISFSNQNGNRVQDYSRINDGRLPELHPKYGG